MKMRFQQQGLLRTPRTNYGWANAAADIGAALIEKGVKDKEEAQAKNDAASYVDMLTYNPQVNTSGVVNDANFNSQLPSTGLLSGKTLLNDSQPSTSLMSGASSFFDMPKPTPQPATPAPQIVPQTVLQTTQPQFNFSPSISNADWDGVSDNAKQGALGLIDYARKNYGVDPTVTSGFRDEQRNADANGAPNSWHLSGNAVDMDVSGLNDEQRAALEQQAKGKFGEVLYHDAGSGLHLHVANPIEQPAPQPAPQSVPQQSMQIAQQTTPATSQNHAATADEPWTTRARTWNDINGEYNKAWAEKMKEVTKNMSPDSLKQYMPQILQARQVALQQLKDDWTKEETNRNWTAFENAKTPHEKLLFAVKNGLDANGVKMLMSPEYESSLVDFGGTKRLIGKNKYTGEAIDMVTKNPITQDDLVNTMTPAQQAGNELGWANHNENVRHNQATESIGAARGSGGGAAENRMITNAKYVLAQHENWKKSHTDKMTGAEPDERQSPYYQYAQQAQKIIDSYFGVERPEAASIPQTGNARIDGMAANMAARGATPQQINDMIWEEQNKQQPQANQYGTGFNQTLAQVLGNAETPEWMNTIGVNELGG